MPRRGGRVDRGAPHTAAGASRGPRRGRAAPMPSAEGATVKLHKALAQAGLGSRRDMEDWIRAGRVRINGEVAGLGARVAPGDEIQVGRQQLRVPADSRGARVLLYHKPEGEMTTRDDPQGRPTVFARLPRVRGAKWLSVGRLDYNTSGLLVFTTSGDLANRMAHPRFALEREYAVRVMGTLSPEQAERLTHGVKLQDGPASLERLEGGSGRGVNHWYVAVTREGRNRIVRRMFDAVGARVSRLMRTRFGPIALPPRLRRGQSAELSRAEVSALLDWLDAQERPAPPAQERAARA